MRTARRSPLRNGYLVKQPVVNLALRAHDAWLQLRRSRAAAPAVCVPRRLLVCVGGHLGDALLATSILPLLRATCPETEIGVVAGSWSLPVFEEHPGVRWRHVVDHWKVNRSGTPIERWRAYRRSAARALEEIRAIGYDAAVDLYPFFPNAAHLLASAAIPIRVGYTSGGGGPLYTHAIPWVETPSHTADQHRELLRAVVPELPSDPPHYDLPALRPAAERRGRTLLEGLGIDGCAYAVLHPGAGNPKKQWPSRHWQAFVARLRTREPELRIVLSGHGPADAALVGEIRAHDDSLISACNRTDWEELRYLLSHAAVVIGVDSMAVHLAAAQGVPCIAIMAAMSEPSHWRPLGARAWVLTESVPCAPCFRSRGCAAMQCVRGVTVDAVESAAVALLQSAPISTS